MALDDLISRVRRPAIAALAALTLLPAPACDARHPRLHSSHGTRSRTAATHSGRSFAELGPPAVGYKSTVPDHNFRGVDLADRNLAIGRIQRTERWRNIIETVEDRYGIPRNTIYAVIMQESYGDPIQPNASGDGGLGLIHFQPGTARAYGLNIVGNSHASGRDSRHGRQLRELLSECNYNLPCVLREDDRAHPVIIVDAIARYLKDGFARKGNWWGAVGTINPGQGSYARRISRWQGMIEKNRGAAAQDFNQRNSGKKDGTGHGMTFDHYIGTFLETNERNYGLGEYRRMRR